MKIIYRQNPLYTIVDLDEHDKQIFWHKLKIEKLQNLIHSAHFILDINDTEFYNAERAYKELDPSYFCIDNPELNKSPIDKDADRLLEYYINELQQHHLGDCTCVAMSCGKCYAESVLGIDTLKGLGKHEGAKIAGIFNDANVSIDEAIKKLENYEPVANWKGWEAHIDRWKQEAANALEWLKQYRDTHFSS